MRFGYSNCFAGYKVAQVRIVFEIPNKAISEVYLSLEISPPTHLTYVEWFSPIPATPNPNSLLYRVSRLTCNGQHRASIIPIDSLLCSAHLFHQFGPSTPQEWNTFSVIESCTTFYLNLFSDRHNYLIFVYQISYNLCLYQAPELMDLVVPIMR